MKMNNRPYEKDAICHGCKEKYLVNSHLLECDTILNKNYDYLTQMRTIFNKHEIYDYEVEYFFTDYGLKKFL